MAIDWSKSSRFDRPIDSPGFMLWQSFHAWKRTINATLEPFELTQLQFSLLACLAWLRRSADVVTQQELATFTSIDKMQVSQVLKKLEAAGLVERRANPVDRRAWNLMPTKAGERLLTRVLPAVEQADRVFFEASTRAPQLRQLLAVVDPERA